MVTMQSLMPSGSLSELVSTLPAGCDLWAVDLPTQKIYRTIPDSDNWESAPVSTSLRGIGDVPDSGCTPVGWHSASEIIGRDATPGQRFESRLPVGDPLPPSDWRYGEGDAILSRIVRLHGLEDCNRHSFERFIYIHGTHQEERLGSPASFGCIRMANDTLVRWVNELPDNELRVWIGALTATP